ncbi:hypothetical protein B4U84_27940 [Westiellopsis prolifica IICB1]|nr:hypothetical protein B4U84_27940 [Westiellopsis prolifica IICB1]
MEFFIYGVYKVKLSAIDASKNTGLLRSFFSIDDQGCDILISLPNNQLPVISYQLSVTSYQLPVTSYQIKLFTDYCLPDTIKLSGER